MKEHVEFAYSNTYRVGVSSMKEGRPFIKEYCRGVFYNFLKQALPKSFDFFTNNRPFYRHTLFFVNALYMKEYTATDDKQFFFKVAFDPNMVEHWNKYNHVSYEGKLLIDALNNF